MSAVRAVFEMFPPGRPVADFPRVFSQSSDVDVVTDEYLPNGRPVLPTSTMLPPAVSTLAILECISNAPAAHLPPDARGSSAGASANWANWANLGRSTSSTRKNVVKYSAPVEVKDAGSIHVVLSVNGDAFLGRGANTALARLAAAKAALRFFLGPYFNPYVFF